MRTEHEIKSQVTALRERVKELSGFYIGEGAAMFYVLEWVLGKRETSPAGELGSAGGDSQQIAVNLTKLAEKAAEAAASAAAATPKKAGAGNAGATQGGARTSAAKAPPAAVKKPEAKAPAGKTRPGR
ncbi:MAG: hypothetical protein ABI914_00850 [Acidobacteriota bacterium]